MSTPPPHLLFQISEKVSVGVYSRDERRNKRQKAGDHIDA